MTTDFYIYTLNEQGASRRLVSPLDETFATQHGLVKEAIAGEFTGEGTDPASFTANPSFVQFLQWAEIGRAHV